MFQQPVCRGHRREGLARPSGHLHQGPVEMLLGQGSFDAADGGDLGWTQHLDVQLRHRGHLATPRRAVRVGGGIAQGAGQSSGLREGEDPSSSGVGVVAVGEVGLRTAGLEHERNLPFVFEASGSETHFTNGYDPNPRARRVFAFPQPATLARTLRDATADPDRPTWRGKVAAMPELDIKRLRPAQITAIGGIERSLAEQHFDRSLVQMATGAGKTFAAVTTAYRLLKHGGFNRVLFLVDRNNLADQTLAEFQNYRIPVDGRRFTEIYNVDKLTGAGMLGSSKVVVSTIQRVFKALSGDQVTDQDDPNLDD